MRRVNVVGASSSGKTTLAKSLAAIRFLPHVELDVLYRGGEGPSAVSNEVFRGRVREAVAESEWLIDGDRAAVRALIWQRADTVVWLDYPLPVVLWRYCRRTLRRRRGDQAFWPETGSWEGWRRMFRRGSLLRLIVRTHGRRREELLDQAAAHPSMAVVRLRLPSQATRWLKIVAEAPR